MKLKNDHGHATGRRSLKRLAKGLGIQPRRSGFRSVDARREELLGQVIDALCGSKVNRAAAPLGKS
jgi:hypothetical protein